MLLPRREAVIYSFPYFVPIFLSSFWDLRLGWGSSGNLATRDSGKVGAVYQNRQLQIFLQLNLSKSRISLCKEIVHQDHQLQILLLLNLKKCKDFGCALNPLAGNFRTQWTRRKPFPWQLWCQASGRREEGKLEMSQNKSCWTFLI